MPGGSIAGNLAAIRHGRGAPRLRAGPAHDHDRDRAVHGHDRGRQDGPLAARDRQPRAVRGPRQPAVHDPRVAPVLGDGRLRPARGRQRDRRDQDRRAERLDGPPPGDPARAVAQRADALPEPRPDPDGQQQGQARPLQEHGGHVLQDPQEGARVQQPRLAVPDQGPRRRGDDDDRAHLQEAERRAGQPQLVRHGHPGPEGDPPLRHREPRRPRLPRRRRGLRPAQGRRR